MPIAEPSSQGKKRPTASYHHPDLRSRLLAAALDILRTEGSPGLTIRALATRVGVSHAAPYRHFASKEEIIATLLLDGHRILGARLREAREASPGPARHRLVALGRAYLSFAAECPAHLRLMFSREGMAAVASLGPAALAGLNEPGSFAPLALAVGECQAEGSLDPAQDTEALALLYWSQVHGLALLRAEGLIAGLSRVRGRSEEETMGAILRALESTLAI